MIDYGADALILEGSEAGGHIGHVSTIVLIQQVLFRYPSRCRCSWPGASPPAG